MTIQEQYNQAENYKPRNPLEAITAALSGFAGDPEALRRRKLNDVNNRMALELAIGRLDELNNPERRASWKLENDARRQQLTAGQYNIDAALPAADVRQHTGAQQKLSDFITGAEVNSMRPSDVSESDYRSMLRGRGIQTPEYTKPESIAVPTGTMDATGTTGKVMSPAQMITHLVTANQGRKNIMPMAAGGSLVDITTGDVVAHTPERDRLDNSTLAQWERFNEKYAHLPDDERLQLWQSIHANQQPGSDLSALAGLLSGGGATPAGEPTKAKMTKTIVKSTESKSAAPADSSAVAALKQKAAAGDTKAQAYLKSKGISY